MKLPRFAVACATVLFASIASIGAAESARAQESQVTLAHRAAMDNAKALAKGGSLAAVEQTLAGLSRAKRESANWHFDLAQRLLSTMDQLAREAQTASIPGLATAALAHLDQAAALSGDPRVKARAKTFAGFIHERYRGDSAAAHAHYLAAAELAPNASTHAKEAAKRLRPGQVTEAALNAGK